jgi:hypothetical protein
MKKVTRWAVSMDEKALIIGTADETQPTAQHA